MATPGPVETVGCRRALDAAVLDGSESKKRRKRGGKEDEVERRLWRAIVERVGVHMPFAWSHPCHSLRVY